MCGAIICEIYGLYVMYDFKRGQNHYLEHRFLVIEKDSELKDLQSELARLQAEYNRKQLFLIDRAMAEQGIMIKEPPLAN